MSTLGQAPGEGSRSEMRVRNANDSHPPVEFAVSPASRLWIASCLGLGGLFLFAAVMHSLGTILMSFEHRALEALFLP